MRKTVLMLASVATAILIASGVGVLMEPRSAEAAFPGKNSQIAYNRAFDFWTKNASLGSPETKLFDTAAHLTYSPDGSRVAFMRANEIYVANANGSGTPRNLTNSPLLDWNPVWSHDGTRIAFVRRGSDNVLNIWTMNANGTAQTQLTTQASSMPAWSVPVAGAPDGKIAFVRGGAIWTMLADGTGQTQLQYSCPTENGGVCDNAVGNPTFSPDGSEIAAEYFGDIFVVPSGGGVSRVILGTPLDGYPGQELDPAWSPDGSKIAFEHNGNVPGSAYGIYMANANGSSTQATQLTSKTGEVDPDWQQDSIKPTVSGMSPRHTSIIRDTTPTIKATVKDRQMNLRKNNTKLYVNGKLISATKYSYSAATDKLTYNSPKLPKGKKTIKIVATDAAKNVGAKSWYFTVK